MSSITQRLTSIDLFQRDENSKWVTGAFVGRPFRLSYTHADLLVSDYWKDHANGIPHGAFLLAYYDNAKDDPLNQEALLLRVTEPVELPTDKDVVSSMIEYYKDNLRTGDNPNSQLDEFTRYEFSFSGLRCTILGSFYREKGQGIRFGADLENFYSAHNYSVIKPSPEILEFIVNYREHGNPGGPGDIRIGRVRYSSSQRFQGREPDVPVHVNSQDFAGKRTALFGMTRTGKSNTVKTIIQACVKMSGSAPHRLDAGEMQDIAEVINPFTDAGFPKYPIGQIVFDLNGEYANPNLQDQGTAIFDLYQDITERYSVVEQPNFKVLKVNFYKEVEAGFGLIRSYPDIASDSTRFVANFRNVSLEKPENYDSDRSAQARYDRQKAVYLCCLYRAGFTPPDDFKVRFTANQDVRDAVGIEENPRNGMTLERAAQWWETLWRVYSTANVFEDYKRQKGHEWADDDLKALLAILTRRSNPGDRQPDQAGFRILKSVVPQHTATVQVPFDQDILEQLRRGRIVIVDLSLGDEEIQKMYTERIVRRIFSDAMARFRETRPNNFIQFYFEEAHNLFPKKEDKDLSQIYNRLAKEGAKLHLGLVYATQEVSSISSNILKATQNWFVSHLNNDDEIRELRKYYDFSDFASSLIRFSQDTDKGFVRMKAYSNPFVVPVQIDRFPSTQGDS